MAAPEVLEAAEPATDADLPGHSPENRPQEEKVKKSKSSAESDADVGMVEATPDLHTTSK